MENIQKMLEEIAMEYNRKQEEMEKDFEDRIYDFESEDWTETELIAFDLGFSKALLIVLDILKENGVE